MKEKDLRIFRLMHELAERFNHNKNGANFNAVQLCQLDNTVIQQLIDEGYRPSEIMKSVTKVFQKGKKRYKILKKYIDDFEKNNKK